MDNIKIYEDYTNVLMELNDLQVAYRNLNREESATGREILKQQIDDCRSKLNSITEKLIHGNPFLKGKANSANALSE